MKMLVHGVSLGIVHRADPVRTPRPAFRSSRCRARPWGARPSRFAPGGDCRHRTPDLGFADCGRGLRREQGRKRPEQEPCAEHRAGDAPPRATGRGPRPRPGQRSGTGRAAWDRPRLGETHRGGPVQPRSIWVLGRLTGGPRHRTRLGGKTGSVCPLFSAAAASACLRSPIAWSTSLTPMRSPVHLHPVTRSRTRLGRSPVGWVRPVPCLTNDRSGKRRW